ncbi:MAG TPA: hypothetical protein VGG20_28305 [Thermoanaerobaculia bacterium]|jgi:hypothetical protein
MVGSEIDDYGLPGREKSPDIEKSALALPIPKHEAAFGVSGHRGILKSVIVEAALIGSLNRPDGPPADVVPTIRICAVDGHGPITALCEIGLDRSIAAVGVTDDHGILALHNVV